MDQVRLGLIGCGQMARGAHMNAIKDLPRVKITAASDVSDQNLKLVTDAHGAKGFKDPMELLASGLVDAVLIATPHYHHPLYAIAAMNRGLHVYTEKPVAVTAKAAAEMNEAAARNKVVYAVNFQLRSLARWRKVKEIISTGQIGPIQRVNMTVTHWFRSQAYFDSGSWRGTWAGEGGGLLLNQCPHNLDLLCWLTGTPRKVFAKVAFGKYHKIEVEDEVTALLEYSNGATGVFIASTGEAPGSNFLEIAGDRGKLYLGPTPTIELTQTEVPASEFCRTSKSMWGGPPTIRMTIETADDSATALKRMHENFAAAILDGTPLYAPGAEGLASLELANAILMSGWQGQPTDLPIDREGYDRLLQKRINPPA